MAVRTKTRRRLRLLTFTVLSLVVAAGAAYLIRQRQISARILAGRATGYAALEAGDYYTALHKIGPYLQRNAEDTEALFKYAQARQNVPEPNSKHISDAMSLYRRLLELNPAHEGAREKLLDLYVRHGFNTELLEITKGREDARSRRARVVALARMGRFEEALPLAEANTAADALNLEQQVLVLELMRQSGKPVSDILAHAQQLHEQHPDDPRFELLLSMAHLVNQDKASALDLARRAASRTIDDPSLVSALVDQLDVLESFAEARAVLEQASARPDGKPFKIRAMRRLLNDGEPQAVIDRLADIQPSDRGTDAELLALRALAQLRLEQRDQATPIITALAERKNDLVANAWASVLQAVFPDGKRRDGDVIRACADAIQKLPANPYFHFYLGEAYSRAGDPVAALRQYIPACQLDRAWAAPLNAVARAMLAAGQRQNALEAAEAARARAPADADVLLTLATARLSIGPSSDESYSREVMELIDQVSTLAPDNQDCMVLRVAVLAQLDRKPEASELIGAYLQHTPPLSTGSLLQLASISRAHNLGLESKCFEAAERVHGTTPELALARALEAGRDGNPQDGVRLFEAARQRASDPASRDWQLASARYLETIRDGRAREQWMALAAGHPDDAAVQQIASAAPSVRGERQFLRETIDRLGNIVGPDGIEWRIADAQWVLAGEPTEQDIVRVTVVLNDLVRRVPEHVQCRRVLAECLVKLEKPNEAIEQLFLAARYDPQSNAVLLRLGSLLHSTAQFERAEPILAQIRHNLARSRPGENLEERRALAQLLSERGDTDQAIDVLEELAAAGDQPKRVDLQLAGLYAQRGALTEEMCDALLEDPEPATIGLVAGFYASRGDEVGALEVLERLDTLSAKPGVAQLVRARYYDRYGTPQQVLEQMTAATVAAPDDARTWRGLFVHHILRGERAEVTAVIAQARKAIPTNAEFERVERHIDLIAPLLEYEPARALAAALLDPSQDHDAAIEALQIISSSVQRSDMTIVQVLPQLQPLARRAPGLLPLQQLLATLHLAAGQTEEGLAVATRAMQLFPNEPEPARLAAQSLAVLGRWREVVPVAEHWKDRAPQAALQADALIAAAQLSSGEDDAALKTVQPHLAAAISDPLRNADILRIYLHASVLTGRGEEAAAVVQPVLPTSATLRATWMQLAGQMQAEPATAEAWLTTVEPLIDSSSVAERMMLAQAWMILAQRTSAPAHHSAAIQALELASRDLHNAPRSTPQEWEGIGMLYDAAGKPDAAEESYRKALELKSDLPLAQNNLAMILANRGGDLSEALALATKAAAHRDHPLCASFLDTLATVQAKLGQHAEAATALVDAVERDPRNLQWRVNLVRALADSGQHEKAQIALREIDQRLAETANLPADTRQQLEALRAKLP